MSGNRYKDRLGMISIMFFCLFALPGLNPLEFIQNVLAPKAAYADCQVTPVTPIASHDPNDKLISIGEALWAIF